LSQKRHFFANFFRQFFREIFQNRNIGCRKVEFKDSEDEEEDEAVPKPPPSQTSARRHRKGSGSKSKKHSRKSPKRKVVAATSDDDDEEEDDDEGVSAAKPEIKSAELTTVDIDELTNLLSKPKVYFAKKSHPAPGTRAAGELAAKPSEPKTPEPWVQVQARAFSF
jgi:hypothetical protein